ncbi:tetratricopeptide repeat protein [Nonomuraea sp. NPDC046570]|uniref:tetratricopeptide repeat protein n=1 Tax=Nonomuraea sp. NPDC046570 TaxID=3155255 RepID=UPI00340B0BB8
MRSFARVVRKVASWAGQHLLLWFLIAGLVNIAAIALTTTLMQLPGQQETVITTLLLVLIVSLVLSIALPIGGYAAERRFAIRAAEIARGPLLIIGTPHNLPKLSELSNEELGVTATKYSMMGRAPYIGRLSDDSAVRDLISSDGAPYPFVVLWGLSKAGKTRTAVEAVRATLEPNTKVLRPISGGALVELLQDPLIVKSREDSLLIWLDDAAVSDFDALTSSALDRIADIGMLFVTMTARRYADLATSMEAISSIGRLALLRASTYELQFRQPTAEERRLAATLYPEEEFASSIAETLVGGAELIAKYRASADLNPAGCALVRAAVDARRIGLMLPLAEDRLHALFKLYLPKIRAGLEPTQQLFREALTWASNPVSSQVAILSAQDVPGGRRGWTLLDHIVSADEGRDGYPEREIVDEVWTAAIEGSSPEEALQIGTTAFERDLDVHAAMGLQAAASSKNPRVAAVALFNLGMVNYRNEEYENAELAYRLAIDYEHEDVSPLACANIGVVLAKTARIEESIQYDQRAIDSGHRDARPLGAYNLAQHYASISDHDAAIACYGIIIEERYSAYLPAAYLNTGMAYSQKGDLCEAARFYRLAFVCQDRPISAQAAVNLGIIYQELEDYTSAARFYRTALESEQEEYVARAARGLVRMWTSLGNAEEARKAYQRAMTQNHAEHSVVAAFDYGVFLVDIKASECEITEALDYVIQNGDSSSVVHGAMVLGRYFTVSKKWELAVDYYLTALDSNQGDLRPSLMGSLGECLVFLGRYSEAIDAFRGSFADGHVERASIACNKLGDLLAEHGEGDLAKAAYRLAFEAQHDEYSPRAALGLALCCINEGDAESGMAMLKYALESQREPYASMAQEMIDDFFE